MKHAAEEREREFIREALAADAAVEKGAPVYRAEDVHGWIMQLAQNPRAVRPKPWSKQSIS